MKTKFERLSKKYQGKIFKSTTTLIASNLTCLSMEMLHAFLTTSVVTAETGRDYVQKRVRLRQAKENNTSTLIDQVRRANVKIVDLDSTDNTPHLAFFALRSITSSEDLSFEYIRSILDLDDYTKLSYSAEIACRCAAKAPTNVPTNDRHIRVLSVSCHQDTRLQTYKFIKTEKPSSFVLLYDFREYTHTHNNHNKRQMEERSLRWQQISATSGRNEIQQNIAYYLRLILI
uniref:Uncharacterized protein n=1 Tax=Glossina brevipalpis TaxID=37001 RepID=A0A1A9X277_9MUSC